MNKIHLPNTDIITTQLGFGCGQLMRTSSARARQKLLNVAYDAGVSHFDVARMYGLGKAEKELGKFARNKRDELIIGTKFGIDLNTSGARLARLQGIARKMIEVFPALRMLARRSSGGMIAPRNYEPKTAQISLETSLRELGTDYIDLFMLHEPTIKDINNSDILEFLVKAKSQGKIRAFGVSGDTDDVLDIYSSYPELTPLVQTPNNAVTRDIDKLLPEYNGALITYSPFSSSINMIIQHLKKNPVALKRWNDTIGMDCAAPDNIAILILYYCKSMLPNGVVLFSTSKPDRLKMLVESVSNTTSIDKYVSAFIKCIDEDLTNNK